MLTVPEEFSNPFTCLQYGQAFLASTQIGRDLIDDPRFWVKVACVRTHKGGPIG